MKKIRNLTILIDLFGHTPAFVINDKLLYKTFFGGIITIVVIIIAVISTIFFSQELFLRKSPSVNLSTETNPNPEKINFYNNFEFAISLQNPNYVPEINESIYYGKGFIFKTIVNSSGTFNIREDLNLKPCNQILNESVNYELFKELKLDGFYCISNQHDNVDKDDVYLNEFWGNNEFRMIQIKLYDCVNTTNKNNCASKEVIDEYLNLTSLSYYVLDNYVRTNNYKNPFQRALKEYFFYASNKFLLSLTQYFHHAIIDTDDGLIFTTSHKTNSYKIDSMVQNTIFQRDDEHFVSLSFQLNNNIEKYHRNYYKVQTLAAQVGGIYNVLFLICLIFIKFYEDNSYFQFLINQFFEVRFEDLKIQNTSQSFETPSKKKTISRKNMSVNLKNVTSQIKKQKKNELKLSFNDKLIFLNCFTKYSKAKKDKIDMIFIKGKQHIMEYLNIISYIKNTHTNEMKTNFILDKNQKKIFEYVFKPIISHSFLGTRYKMNELPYIIKERIIGIQKEENEKVLEKINKNLPTLEKTNTKKKSSLKKQEITNDDNDNNDSSDNNEISSESKL